MQTVTLTESTLGTLPAAQDYQLRVQPHLASTGWYAATLAVNFTWSSTTGWGCGLDTSTQVAIASIAADSGTSATDLITNVAANTVRGTGEPGATVVLTRAGTQVGTATVAADGTWSVPVTLTEGAATYTATATAQAGNTATASHDIRLDTVAPVVTQAAPCTTTGNPVSGVAGATWCRQTSLGWSMTATDTGGSGIATREYADSGTAYQAYSGTVTMAEAAGRVMRARATDVAGNVSTVSTGTYYVDGTGPTLTVTAPSPGLSLSLAVLGPLLNSSCSGMFACGTSSDAVSGQSQQVGWKLTHDGLLSDTCYTASGTTSCTGYAFQAGRGTLPSWEATRSRSVYSVLSSYVFAARAVDNAGNVTTVEFTFSTVL